MAVYETEESIPEGKNGIGKRQFVAVGCELPRNEGIGISLKGQWKESKFNFSHSIIILKIFIVLRKNYGVTKVKK